MKLSDKRKNALWGFCSRVEKTRTPLDKKNAPLVQTALDDGSLLPGFRKVPT